MKNRLLIPCLVIFLVILISTTIAAAQQNQNWPVCIDKISPSAPGSLVLSNNVAVSWSAATDQPDCSGVEYYKVYRGNALIGTATSTSFNDGPLADGTYTYKVSAVDRAGNEGPFATNSITIGSAQGGSTDTGGSGGGGGGGGGSGGSGGSAAQQTTTNTIENEQPPQDDFSGGQGSGEQNIPQNTNEDTNDITGTTENAAGDNGVNPAFGGLAGMLVGSITSPAGIAGIVVIIILILVYIVWKHKKADGQKHSAQKYSYTPSAKKMKK